MSDRGVLFLTSLVVIAASLGAAVWLVVTGQAAYLDGIFLVVTCLVTALAFGLYVVFLIRRAMAELKAPPANTKAAAAAGSKPPAATASVAAPKSVD